MLKKLPLPMSGLFLSILTLGNLLESYSASIRWLLFSIALIFYLLYIMKLVSNLQDVKHALHNPLVASSFPVIAMATVVLSSYAVHWSYTLAKVLWYGAFLFYCGYIPFFSHRFVKNFTLNNVYATWYIVYVGIAICGIFTRVSGNYFLGKFSFWFGFLLFLSLMPIICYRATFVNKLQPLEIPSLVVLAAPASLLFLAYHFANPNKSNILTLILFSLSLVFYIVGFTFLPKIFSSPFYPTWSATTFPMVTGAFVTKIMLTEYTSYILILTPLYYSQLVVAIFVVSFVSYSYTKFLLNSY